MVETEQVEAPYLKAKFFISQERLAHAGRSLQLLLLQRRCSTCWGTLVKDSKGAWKIPVKEHLKQIAKQCSKMPEYIHADMPLAEAVFRVLLSNGTKPMVMEKIYAALEDRWVDPINPRIPTSEGVYRMMGTDTFYGITEEAPKGL